ncbi:MAG: hypothetical protein VX436_01175, partial [Planctomycetota bacterium]|nr:hypothetical protein [Planctomycetota bacterium]
MPEPNKYFLGWDKPFLSTAAKWLLEHCLQDELGTSDRLLILVSGQAISKRLQSIFIHEANKVGRAVELPKILTPSQLFRNFIEMQGRIADPTTTLLATVAILKSMDPHIIAPIVGSRRPREKDFTAWLRIARHVCDAMSTAAGNGYSIDQSEWPASAKAILTESAIKRFDLLKEIQNNLWESLHKQGLSIFEYEQLALLQESKQLDLGLVERLVVVGAPDLAGIATQLLGRMLEQDVTIDILIRAPESESLGFDAYGCIDTSCWINREIEINDAAITVSGSPSAQAAAVIRKLEQLGDSVTTDQITISSTDESLIPII